MISTMRKVEEKEMRERKAACMYARHATRTNMGAPLGAGLDWNGTNQYGSAARGGNGLGCDKPARVG